jgi:hypothetical protein
MYRRRALNTSSQRISQEYGWKTTRTSKPLMIDDLGKALKNDELILHCDSTIAELRTFVRNDRGSMSGSPYDDRVMALAVANQMRKFAYVPEYVQHVDDTWTFDWWMRQLPSGVATDDTIGTYLSRGTA